MSQDLQEQLNRVEAEIAHLLEKQEVQAKRIKYLRKENEEYKAKQPVEAHQSAAIHEQNQALKARNKALKKQLQELKSLLPMSSSNLNSLESIVIRQVAVNSFVDEIDLPKQELTDLDIDPLRNFNHLKSLILGENALTDRALLMVSTYLPNLRKLFMNHNQITDQGLKSVGNLRELRCLDLRCNKLSSGCLKPISSLSNLTQLSLSNNQIQDEGLDELVNLKELSYLDITSNRISHVGGMSIGRLGQLANLYLSHNLLSYECAEKYISFPQLKVLDIRFNRLSTEDKERIRESVGARNIQIFL